MSWTAAKQSDDDDFELVHYCLLEECPLGCAGRRDVARKHVVAAVRLIAGGPMTTPLLHRWKGFEQAVSFAYRARECGDLLRRAWSKAYPPARVRQAEEEAAQGANDPESVGAAVKNTIRAGKTVRWLIDDAGG
eukprot:6573569-Pyramimonas_sp.AAC.1